MRTAEVGGIVGSWRRKWEGSTFLVVCMYVCVGVGGEGCVKSQLYTPIHIVSSEGKGLVKKEEASLLGTGMWWPNPEPTLTREETTPFPAP